VKCRAPTWESCTKRAAKGALCHVVFGRYMPMSRPTCVGIAQWKTTSIAATSAAAIAIGFSSGDGSAIPSPGRPAPRPMPTPAATAPRSTQPGR
jgi:hypothetical protein